MITNLTVVLKNFSQEELATFGPKVTEYVSNFWDKHVNITVPTWLQNNCSHKGKTGGLYGLDAYGESDEEFDEPEPELEPPSPDTEVFNALCKESS